MRQNHRAVRRWRTCKCLIVDEVSMMSAELFEGLNQIAQDIRCSTLPFGGFTFHFQRKKCLYWCGRYSGCVRWMFFSTCAR